MPLEQPIDSNSLTTKALNMITIIKEWQSKRNRFRLIGAHKIDFFMNFTQLMCGYLTDFTNNNRAACLKRVHGITQVERDNPNICLFNVNDLDLINEIIQMINSGNVHLNDELILITFKNKMILSPVFKVLLEEFCAENCKTMENAFSPTSGIKPETAKSISEFSKQSLNLLNFLVVVNHGLSGKSLAHTILCQYLQLNSELISDALTENLNAMVSAVPEDYSSIRSMWG